MKKIIRLTEQDLARIVRRVIIEQKTHSGLYELEKLLSPYGFEFDKTMQNNVSKGDDMNGASIGYIKSEDKYYLSVVVDGESKVSKEYQLVEPDYRIDVNKIIKDLGDWKNYKFKKTKPVG